MGEIIRFKRPGPKDRNRGKTLCLRNFHRWQVETARRFDVKQGRLVTLYRCERCGREKTELL